MTDARQAYTTELAKAADLVRHTGCASDETLKLAGLHLEHEGDGWWSVYHPDIGTDHNLLDVLNATDYRRARDFYDDVYQLVHRESSDPDPDGHRHGREVA